MLVSRLRCCSDVQLSEWSKSLLSTKLLQKVKSQIHDRYQRGGFWLKLFTFNVEVLPSIRTAAAPTLLHVKAVSKHHPLLLNSNVTDLATFTTKAHSFFPAPFTLLPLSHQPRKKGQPPEQLSVLDTVPTFVPGQPDVKESGVKRELCRSHETESQIVENVKESCHKRFPREEMVRGAKWESRASYEFHLSVKHHDKFCHWSGKKKGHPCSYFWRPWEVLMYCLSA